MVSRCVISLGSGVLFGAGLTLSGMTDRNKILGFLDIFGSWDPSVLFVMLGALTISVPAFHFILKSDKPLFDAQFFLPEKSDIDAPLIVGAILFGVGWGLYGYCPGPALAALVYGNSDTVVFVGAMLFGMACKRIFLAK